MGRIPITMVSGLRATDRSTVSGVIAPGATPTFVDEEWVDSDLSGALLRFVDRLDPDDGLSPAILDIDPRVSSIETGLLLEQLTGDESTEGRIASVLRDVVTVAAASDLRDLLLCADVEGREDDAGRLADLIEFATIVVVTGLSDGRNSAAGRLGAVISRLNPRALVMTTAQLRQVLSAETWQRPRRAHRLGETFGWMLELRGLAKADAVHRGVDSLVFRDPRPFHPERLARFVDHGLEPERAGAIVRSRGLISLASRPERVASWSIAGRSLTLEPTSMLSFEADTIIGQELVFFGVDLNTDHLTAGLASCLLRPDELLAGPMTWATYTDPFPAWIIEHGH